MNLNTLLLITLASALAAPAQSTINFTAGVGERDVYLDGAPLPDGNIAEIGFFAAGFDVGANSANPFALADAWNVMGGTPIRSIFGQPGRFAGTLYSTDPLFDDQKIWLWIFKTNDDTVPADDYANVTGYGLYSSTLANWVFPAQDAPPMLNTASITSLEINQSAFGTYDDVHLYLTPVPEPSQWMLGSLGVGALMLFAARGRDTAWHARKK
ncbi:MAG: hypothetical protein JXQ71_08765 [Verrucomicrobia bacterium]|nr:hypothetical protein [Verrucomicrobiota bacterium]